LLVGSLEVTASLLEEDRPKKKEGRKELDE
jgi:hypothetical protein